MAVLQHYYTSFRDPETGGGGFKTKGVSPGIIPATQTLINQLIVYRIPSGVDINDIHSHPTALRYYYAGPDEALLLCSRSSGTDENGRPGNFFAHTVVLPSEQFTSIPPIFYWQSTFWQSGDTRIERQIAPLESFEAEPGLELDDVWRFLEHGNRRETLRKLLAAVIHSGHTSRRIIVYDRPETVALWVAAVSCALPPHYRPLLTFATYHPDPYQAPYLITGTTAGTEFRNSPDEYLRYFILNGETGETSKVDDSAYAAEVAPAMRAAMWDSTILPLLDLSTRRFPLPHKIDAQLDLIVAYRGVISHGRVSPLTPVQLQSLHAVLDGFEQPHDFAEDDIADLQALTTALNVELRRQHDGAVMREYARALSLSQRRDPAAFRNYLTADVMLVTQWLLDGDISSALALLEILARVFGHGKLTAALNDPAYLGGLASLAGSATPKQLLAVWEHLAPSLQPSIDCQGLMAASVRAISPNAGGQLSDDATTLLDEIVRRIVANGQQWLEVATSVDSAVPAASLERLYYGLVRNMPLDVRLPYRRVIQRAVRDIAVREVRLDVQCAGAQGAIPTLERWAAHAASSALDSLPWLAAGLEVAQAETPRTAWRQVAIAALISPALRSHLPQEWQGKLLNVAFGGLSFAGLQQADITLCHLYEKAVSFTRPTASLIIGVLAMDKGVLNQATAARLRERFTNLSAEQYGTELAAFMARFFEDRVTRESHGLMVVSTYAWDYRNLFWNCYWAEFTNMLVDPSRAPQLVALLSFWFDASLSALETLPYVVQSYFLRLPGVVEAARKERGFRETAREVNFMASREAWYPVVDDLFAIERKGILGIFGR